MITITGTLAQAPEVHRHAPPPCTPPAGVSTFSAPSTLGKPPPRLRAWAAAGSWSR